MPETRREIDTESGEQVVKVRRKKKRKDSNSPLRRGSFRLGQDWNFKEIFKRSAVFLLIILVFAGIVYYFLQPPGNGS